MRASFLEPFIKPAGLNTLKSIFKVYIRYLNLERRMQIIFKDNKIQKGYRVKIPKAIVDTLKLREGEKIEVLFDAEKKELIIKEEK